jgi:hypothetical protein
MAENYPPGWRRIWYKSGGFKEGLNVTVDFLSPSLGKFEDLALVEESGGRYYLDFEFNEYGDWIGTIYENGEKVSCQAYWIYSPSRGGGDRGPGVINT